MLPGILHNMLTGGAAGAAPGPVLLQGDTIEAYAVSPADAIGGVTFSNTGQATLYAGIPGAIYPYSWLNSGAASAYEINWQGTWLNMGTSRTVYASRSLVGVGSVSYTVQIRVAATGIVVASETLSFWLEVNT